MFIRCLLLLDINKKVGYNKIMKDNNLKVRREIVRMIPHLTGLSMSKYCFIHGLVKGKECQESCRGCMIYEHRLVR